MRVGIGYDVHRFAKNRKLILGGIEIPFDKGLLGHSDADVLVRNTVNGRWHNYLMDAGLPVLMNSRLDMNESLDVVIQN